METEEIFWAIQQAADTIATPNWADIASVGLSLLAVSVAGFVAWKQFKIANEQNAIVLKQAEIADKQNQIALFDKRFELYNILKSCTTSPEIIKLVKEDKDILKYLAIVFGRNSEATDELDNKEASLYLTNCSLELQQSIFLFSKEITQYIVSISAALLLLACADVEAGGQERFNEKKQGYLMSIKEFEDKGGLRRIRDEMNII